MSEKPERPLWESAGGWRLWQKPLAAGLILLAVISLLLIPSISSWFMQRAQGRVLDGYADLVQNAPAGRIDQLREDARELNQELEPHAYLFPGVAKPLAQSDPSDLGAERAELPEAFATAGDYQGQLNLGDGVMSRLYFPAVGVDAPVLHWANESTLSSGVGQVPSSSLPVGGEGTMTALVGSTKDEFRGLGKAQTGQVLLLQTLGQDLFYQVQEISLLEVHDFVSLEAAGTADLLVLVTSTGSDALAERMVISLSRVDSGDLDATFFLPTKPSSSPGFPLWLLALVLTAGFSAFLVWYSGRPLEKNEEEPGNGGEEGTTRAGKEAQCAPETEPASVARARKLGVLPAVFERSQDFLDYVGEYTPDPRSLAEREPDDSSYPQYAAPQHAGESEGPKAGR